MSNLIARVAHPGDKGCRIVHFPNGWMAAETPHWQVHWYPSFRCFEHFADALAWPANRGLRRSSWFGGLGELQGGTPGRPSAGTPMPLMQAIELPLRLLVDPEMGAAIVDAGDVVVVVIEKVEGWVQRVDLIYWTLVGLSVGGAGFGGLGLGFREDAATGRFEGLELG